MDINENLGLFKKQWEEAKTRHLIAQGQKTRLEEEIENSLTKEQEWLRKRELYDKVQIIFKEAAHYVRQQTKEAIETVVSASLQQIFGTDISFEIVLDEKRGSAAAEFYVVDHDKEVDYRYRAEESRGGGVVDIVSMALRIAFFLKYRPRIEGPLILDEPAKHLSDEYIFPFGTFLNQIAEEFQVQIIMITHNDHLAALGQKAYRVEKVNFESIVKEEQSPENSLEMGLKN